MKTYQFCRRQLALGLGFLFMALLLSMNQVQQQREALAQRIAPSLLRFHILANSDNSADQQVKLEVRSLILDYIQELLPPEQGKKETIRCLREQKAAIEKTASTCDRSAAHCHRIVYTIYFFAWDNNPTSLVFIISSPFLFCCKSDAKLQKTDDTKSSSVPRISLPDRSVLSSPVYNSVPYSLHRMSSAP